MTSMQEALNGMLTLMMVKFCLNDMPHAAGLPGTLGLTDRQKWYIRSKPPSEPYLYHHATYAGLKRVATRWAVEASPGKDTVSLTTDAGRYLSPLPVLVTASIDGVVRMPFTEELQSLTVPALYVTRSQEDVDKVRSLGYTVYAVDEVPPEYRYIMKFVVHPFMFANENEYTVINKFVNVPTGSTIYIHPAKIKRFKAGLPKFSMEDIRSLEELAR